uniref:glycerophosphodiester phosphodiesterase n=1 Tax=Leersia perrieri TaxID=77586 RepID=A0A0D9X5J5_9ORYZ
MARRSRGHGGYAATSLATMLYYYCWFLLLLSVIFVIAAAQRPQVSSTFKTLTGNAPLVIARGGFSGLFPDSSQFAFSSALEATSYDTSLWCDVQLTKDGAGICLRELLMDNCTIISRVYPDGKQTYRINGVQKTGWFPLDYNMSSLSEALWTRTNKFDFCNLRIFSVTGFMSVVKPSSLWLNVEHSIFYTEHGLNMTSYILSVQKLDFVKYISSPELGFLRSLSGGINRKVKLVFRFLDKALSDPSTNKTYNFMLSNLTFIKTIASGIMVPKTYIWPVTTDNYVQFPTQIVKDAHSAGLEIYASDFSNDGNFPYNYSYDPLGEYLPFLSDGDFTVDGVLTDHPLTASEAIGSFTTLNTSRKTDHADPLIISHNGASGDYPDCTDLAYEKAVADGADVIDCSIQITKDGIPICMSSIDLFDTTDIQNSKFSSLASVIPEIQTKAGIFTFNLTWDDINTLRPKISHPYYDFVRDPRYANRGKLFSLFDFMTYALDKDLAGVIIIIKNAAFMAKSLGFDVADLLTTDFSHAGYKNLTMKNKEVMIQSKDSAVLVKLKQLKTHFKLVYTLPSTVGDATASSIEDIKKFADAAIVDRQSVFVESNGFILRETNLVKDLQSAGLAVYAKVFRNEFISPPQDFLADETVEINTYVQLVHVDGFITDFPKTLRRYKMKTCRSQGDGLPICMKPAQIGFLAELLEADCAGGMPPALAPMPVLNSMDVVEPPLPAAKPKIGTSSAGSTPHSAGHVTAAPASAAGAGILLGMVWASLLT